MTIGVTDSGRIAPPWEVNVKTGPPLSLYFDFSVILVFSKLLAFLRFSEYFPVI